MLQDSSSPGVKDQEDECRGVVSDLSSQHSQDEFAAPGGVDLPYIHPSLRRFAVRIDSLTMDPMNIKDHGDVDLPAHMASLQKFGIRRLVVVRKQNRQIEAGNGTVMAAIRNGWEYVPALLVDDDHQMARAFALADNAVGTLAIWNETNLQALKADSPALFDDAELQQLADRVLENIGELVDVLDLEEKPDDSDGDKKDDDGSVMLSHRVIAIFETQEQQIDFCKELKKRGMEFRLSTVQVK